MVTEMNDNTMNKEVFYEHLRPEVRKLAMQMENKFRLHDKDRGNPFNCDDQDFMEDRLVDEEIEMLRAMGRLDKPRRPPSVVWAEAADRCNFILMMAVNYEREWLKGVPKSAETQKGTQTER